MLNIQIFWFNEFDLRLSFNLIVIPTGDITPIQTFQTINFGDTAVLAVARQLNTSLLRWRHNGNEELTDWNGMKSVTIQNASTNDGGYYECYTEGERNKGEHAIFQLLVRGK